MNRVVHFEIHADDPERAAKFYTDVFGWEIKKWEGGQMEYWLVMTAPTESKELGINGGIVRRRGPSPVEGQAVNAFVCTMDVANIDETIKKLESLGSICALPKMALAGMAWQAYYKDTEGNIFGIHQVDKEAT